MVAELPLSQTKPVGRLTGYRKSFRWTIAAGVLLTRAALSTRGAKKKQIRINDRTAYDEARRFDGLRQL